MKFVLFLKSHLFFNSLFTNITLRPNNLKTKKAMNAKISAFIICDEAIIYLLLHNLHDCILKQITQSIFRLKNNFYIALWLWFADRLYKCIAKFTQNFSESGGKINNHFLGTVTNLLIHCPNILTG